MNYLLGIIFFIIIFCLFYAYVLREDDPESYTLAVQNQPALFRVPKDSADVCWTRAKDFLHRYADIISGGDLQTGDSLLFIPYYNSHQKGTSVRITKRSSTASVTFNVEWWYSKRLQIVGSKRIALYMQKGIDK